MAHGGEVARGGKQGREGEVVGSGDMAGMAMSSLAPPLPRVYKLPFKMRGGRGTIWCKLG